MMKCRRQDANYQLLQNALTDSWFSVFHPLFDIFPLNTFRKTLRRLLWITCSLALGSERAIRITSQVSDTFRGMIYHMKYIPFLNESSYAGLLETLFSSDDSHMPESRPFPGLCHCMITFIWLSWLARFILSTSQWLLFDVESFNRSSFH